MAVKSVEMYLEALSFIRKRGAMLGLDSFAANYKPINLLAFMLVFEIISFMMVSGYSCVMFYDDMERVIFCLIAYGLGIQVRNQMTLKKLMKNYIFFDNKFYLQAFPKLNMFWLCREKLLGRAQWKNHQIT